MTGLILIIRREIVCSTLFPHQITDGAILCRAGSTRNGEVILEFRAAKMSWTNVLQEKDLLNKLSIKPEIMILSAEAKFGSLYLSLTGEGLPELHPLGEAEFQTYELPVPAGEP